MELEGGNAFLSGGIEPGAAGMEWECLSGKATKVAANAGTNDKMGEK